MLTTDTVVYDHKQSNTEASRVSMNLFLGGGVGKLYMIILSDRSQSRWVAVSLSLKAGLHTYIHTYIHVYIQCT